MITDNYSRGWHTVGLPGLDSYLPPIMPGDTFLTAVPLKAGKHHFLLEYKPLAFEAGKWVSIASLILYVGMLLGWFWKGRQHKKVIPK